MAKVTSETEVLVEIADKVQIRVTRSAISEVLGKTEPVPAAAETAEKAAPAKRPSRSKKAAAEESVVQPAATPAAETDGEEKKAE